MVGAVMPPEVESGTHLLRNGNPAKSGVNCQVGDLPLLATNGKIGLQESSGKLNANLDLENRPHQEGETEEMVSSNDADQEVTQMPRDQNDRAIGGPVPNEDFRRKEKAANGVSNGDATSIVSEGGRKSSNSDWTATEGSWEVAGDESVLGPGPAQEKAADHKATGTPELYSFWMVRIPRPVDNKGKAEIRMADLRLKEKTEMRDFINAAFQMKRASRAEALDKLRAARDKARACGDAVRSKKDEIEPLQQANRRFREAGRIARDKGRDLPGNEQELDQKIAYLEYRIEHESIPLKEEKLLVREIKNLRACREEVCANAALHAEFTESLAERDEIQERLKPLMAELEALKKEWTAASARVAAAEQEFEKMSEAATEIQAQWAAASRARQEAFDERSRLMRLESARNDEFYQNKRDIQNVRQLAFKKDKKSVEELCNAQVERILDMWNNNAEFRANYVKSNERSTLKRLSTFDGRSLGPDEEPPLIPGDEDITVDSRTEAGPSPPYNARKGEGQSKPHTKSSESKSSSLISTSESDKRETEPEIAPDPVSNGNIAPVKATPVAAPASDASKQKQVEADLAAAAELKEKRRQQEMAKAKEAEERKKRMAERSQSKALARAHKEAEKKEKEKEKRARKKAAAGTLSSSQGVRSSEDTGPEVLQEVESSPEVLVQETHPESKPSSKQRKRAIAAHQQKSVKSVKLPPVPSSITKKDVAIYQQTWFLILLAMVLLFVLLAAMARYVL